MVRETTNLYSNAVFSVRKNKQPSGTESALTTQEYPKKIGLELQYPIIQQKVLDIEFEYPGYGPETWSFKQLSEFYQKPNHICLSNKLGVNYKHSNYDKLRTADGFLYKGIYRGSKINRILCSKFHCDRCRNLLKYALKKEMELMICEHQLHTHFVITTEGTKYRDTNDYIQSYKDMAKSWNKMRKILSYDAKKQGKHFSYICLFRAQKSGYCHLHVLTNLYIPKERLIAISKKYFNTGFIKIKKNKNITHYLTNDFMKDSEFYIPFSRRHYSTSRNIHLDIYGDFNDDGIENPEVAMHIHLRSGIAIIDQIYDQISHEYGYPPPFDFLFAQFQKSLTSTGEKSKTFFVNGNMPPMEKIL